MPKTRYRLRILSFSPTNPALASASSDENRLPPYQPIVSLRTGEPDQGKEPPNGEPDPANQPPNDTVNEPAIQRTNGDSTAADTTDRAGRVQFLALSPRIDIWDAGYQDYGDGTLSVATTDGPTGVSISNMKVYQDAECAQDQPTCSVVVTFSTQTAPSWADMFVSQDRNDPLNQQGFNAEDPWQDSGGYAGTKTHSFRALLYPGGNYFALFVHVDLAETGVFEGIGNTEVMFFMVV
jgi:hypothetical protein